MKRPSPLLERGSRRVLSTLCPPGAAASAAAVEASRRFGGHRSKVPGGAMILARGQMQDSGW